MSAKTRPKRIASLRRNGLLRPGSLVVAALARRVRIARARIAPAAAAPRKGPRRGRTEGPATAASAATRTSMTVEASPAPTAIAALPAEDARDCAARETVSAVLEARPPRTPVT